MSTFNEVQFPPSISQGAQGGMGFNTSVISLSSGDEHRNVNWVRSRGKWDVKHGLKTQYDIEQLIDFFASCFGKAYGFRFKDWLDYRCPRWVTTPGDLYPLPVFFTTDGATTTFQLTKVYALIGGAQFYTRLIQKPVAGSLQLLNNGVQIFDPADWTVDTTTGIVTLSSAIAATTGHQIGGSCEFDVPARFDTDDMQATITTTEIYSWDAIPVVEIRDIT